eukprot:2590780-Pyramimonas_sp.AAC.1
MPANSLNGSGPLLPTGPFSPGPWGLGGSRGSLARPAAWPPPPARRARGGRRNRAARRRRAS